MDRHAFKTVWESDAIHSIVYGQALALQTITHALQCAALKLSAEKGLRNYLLLVGPPDTGKTITAHALATFLQRHQSYAYYQVLRHSVAKPTCIDDVRVFNSDGCSTLLQAVRATPATVILFDDVNPSTADWLTVITDAFTLGLAYDKAGQCYDFSRATLIMTTTMGSDALTARLQQQRVAAAEPDLLQLMLSDTTTGLPQVAPHLSYPECVDCVTPALASSLPSTLLKAMTLIPFFPLNAEALRKTIHTKLQTLRQQLADDHAIELHYAPEVIEFLSAKITQHAYQTMNNSLDYYLYGPLSDAIIAMKPTTRRALQLLLNDTGTILRCQTSVAHMAIR